MIISNVLLFTVEFLKTYIASAGCAVAYNTDCFSEKYESVCALCHFDSFHVMPECGRI